MKAIKNQIIIIKILVIYSMTSIFNFTYAQDKREYTPDTLRLILRESTEDSVHMDTYIRLGNVYKNYDLDSALQYLDSARFLAEKMKSDKDFLRVQVVTASSLWLKSDYDTALKVLDQAKILAVKVNDSSTLGHIYNLIGIQYIHKSYFDLALDNFFIALGIFETQENYRGMTSILNNIGIIYHEKKQYEQALEYFFKSLDVLEKLGISIGSPAGLNNIATIYYDQQKYDDALAYFDTALIALEAMPNAYDHANILEGRANVFIATNKLSDAEENLKKGLEIARQVGNIDSESVLLQTHGKLFLKKSDYSSAIKYLNKSQELAKQTNSLKVISKNYLYLSQADSARGDYPGAFKNFKKYSELKEKMLSNEKDIKLVEFETKIKLANKEKELQLLQKENEIHAIKLNRNKYILSFLTGIIFLLIVLALIVLHNQKLRNNKKINELVQKNLRQQLNPHFLFNTLNNIQSFIYNNNIDAATNYLSKFARLMRKILDNSQNQFVLVKDEIEAIDLYLKLESMRFKEMINSKIIVDKNIDQFGMRIPAFSLQPFIENSIRHGLQNKEGKGNIMIELCKVDECIECVIQDDGIGRDAAKLIKSNSLNGKNKSYGIRIMESRLKMLNPACEKDGAIEITDLYDDKNNPGGTRVRFKLPYIK